jgi:hypothetical protein
MDSVKDFVVVFALACLLNLVVYACVLAVE